MHALGTAIFAKVPEKEGQADRRRKGRGLTSLKLVAAELLSCQFGWRAVAVASFSLEKAKLWA
jgi:hypothetical protein